MKNISLKHTQSLSRTAMLHLLAVSRGEQPADIRIDNVLLLDELAP